MDVFTLGHQERSWAFTNSHVTLTSLSSQGLGESPLSLRIGKVCDCQGVGSHTGDIPH